MIGFDVPQFGVSIGEAKKGFFDRKVVERSMDRKSHAVFGKYGAAVRTHARRSMRRARQARMSELTAEERQKYHIDVYYAEKYGFPKPKRRLMASKPGQPPRTRHGLLRDRLFFSFDMQTRSVVIGPELARPKHHRSRMTGPELLEEGGYAFLGGEARFVEPRPYMGPAKEAIDPHLPRFWREAASKGKQ